MRLTIIYSLIAIGILTGCKHTDKKETKPLPASHKTIQPPLEGVDVPFTEYSFDASTGDTLFYEESSIITFPPNSLIDKNGKIVTGNVQIKYREFTSPIDFYLSGIPMNYDSSGINYIFESSGMCEILAFKDGIPLFVNKESKPEIYFLNNKSTTGQSVYHLDTNQNKWINKGPITVTHMTEEKISPKDTNNSIDIEQPPIRPEKANNKNPIIRLVIDPASFKELLAYDNMQFEITGEGNKFNPADTSYEWSSVDLQKGISKGQYSITFKNSKKTVTYSAKPVLEGQDYEKALRKFEKNEASYRNKLDKRIKKELYDKNLFRLDSLERQRILAENSKIEALNLIIEKRNKVIEKQNNKVLSRNKSIMAINSFLIDGFGIWNCDKPIFLTGTPIIATFRDEKGNMIQLEHIAVIYKAFNGLIQFDSNKISVNQDGDPTIIGVYNGRWGYVPFTVIRSMEIKAENTEQVFPITILSDKESNYEGIKKIMNY